MPQVLPVRSHCALSIRKTLVTHLKNAHHVSEDLLTKSEDKIEKQVGYGGKGSVKNRDHTLSLRSNRSEDSGYASGDAHPVSKNLAAISEDNLAEQAKFSLLLNGRKSESISDLVMSFHFFTPGKNLFETSFI